MMNRAYLTFAKTLSPDTRQDLKEANVKLNEAYTAVETKQLNDKLKQLQVAHNNARHCKGLGAYK